MLKYLLKRFFLLILFISIMGIFLSYLDIFMISRGGKIVDTMSIKDISNLKFYLKIFILLTFISLFTQIILNIIFAYTKKKIITEGESKFFYHLLYINPNVFLKYKTGDIAQRISKDIHSTLMLFDFQYLQFIRNIFYLILSIFYIFFVNKYFGLIFLFSLPVFVILTIFSTKNIQSLYYNFYNLNAKKDSFLIESILGGLTIKSLNLYDYFRKKYSILLENMLKFGLKTDLTLQFIVVVNFLILLSFIIILFIIGSFLVSKELVSIGSFISVFAVFITNFNQYSKIVNGISTIRISIAGLKRLDDLLKEKIEIYDDEKIDFKNELIIKNIRFGYNNTIIFDNLDLKIPKAKILCITGKTGVGKTTLLSLLLGFISPENGEIFCDKVKIKNIISLRKLIGYLPQQPFILDGTLRENIEFGEKYDEEEIKEVLKKVGLDDFLNRTDGLNTILSEGGKNLSGGEKQRIHLARILIRDKDIYLFDEPTSNVDKKTEEIIIETIKELKDKGKTIMVVTHREAPLKIADEIYELEDKKLNKIKGG